MRHKLALVAAALMVVSTTVGLAGPAEAKTKNTIAINKIANKVAKNDLGDDTSLVTVKPSVSKTGKIKIDTQTLLVIAEGDYSPSPILHLGVGRHTIRTDVTFRTFTLNKKNKRVYSATKRRTRTQDLVVFRPCATYEDFQKVVKGDTFAAVKKKLHQAGNGMSGDKTTAEFAYLVCDFDEVGPGSIGIAYSVKDKKPYKVKTKRFNAVS